MSKIAMLLLERELLKVPPGPPPRPGLKWKDETSRWVRPRDLSSEQLPHSEEDSVDSNGTNVESIMSRRVSTEIKGDISLKNLRSIGKHIRKEFKVRKAPTYRSTRKNEFLSAYRMFGYSQVRELMETGTFTPDPYDKTDPRDIIKALEENLSEIKQPQVVYRGLKELLKPISGKERIEVGDVVPIDSYLSTSRAPMKAMGFAIAARKQPLVTFLELDTAPDTRAITFSNTFEKADETVLGAGQVLEIKSIEIRRVYDKDGERQVQYVQGVVRPK